MHDIVIANKIIGSGYPPFIIAEMSANHNQSLERALEIVEAAARAGAHALKLQTYTADTMTLDINEKEFKIDDPKSLWNGYSLYKLYEKAYMPWEWHKPIFKRCEELGIIGISTPFDLTAVDYLEKLNVPAYKVASFENQDIPLLKRIAETGKPVIISTGLANVAELDETVRTVRKAGNNDIILLKCTSSYPASPESTNIRTIPHMKSLFDTQVGLSDHTLGIGVSVASVALGATAIEKHFTLNRSDGGVDSAFSLEPDEMKSLVEETMHGWQALGKISYSLTEKEKRSLQFKRSLYVAEDMKAGDIFTEKNMRLVRPGYGLPPKYYDIIAGKKVNCNIKKGSPIQWELVE
ncbi:MAG: pseudaminic acid synthase [candidate division Zixibacteria bacterium]|nr:pseudaminic acid synthase [candidate division Zixibacteria bacterium]